MYITVIVPQYTPYNLTYRVPQPMERSIDCGVRVEVPSGKSKVSTAVVSSILTSDEVRDFIALMDEKGAVVREILSVVDQQPIVTDQQLRLWKWIASYYMCSDGEVMSYFLPNDLILKGTITEETVSYKKSRSLKKERFLTLEELPGDDLIQKLSKKQQELLSYFLTVADSSRKVRCEAIYEGGFNSTHLRKAIVSGLFTESFEMVHSEITPSLSVDVDSVVMDRPDGFDEIESKLSLPLLVKTNCRENLLTTYLYLINERLSKGESVLVLVDEQTKQDAIVGRINELFADRALSFLSKTSQGRRYKNYCSLLGEGPYVVVGNKSSVGLPFRELSLIIVTDEHSSSYKSENSPRFMTRDVAIVLSSICRCAILLESFAPSVESYYNTTIGKYNLITVPQEMGCRITPINKYSIAAKERRVYGNIPQVRYFSKFLLSGMEETLQSSKSVLLFHNRRGYNSFLLCKDCGWVLRCPNCNVSMTYHKEKRSFLCHYCSQKMDPVVVCGECGSKNLQLKGVGSENIEESIKKHFPLSTVLRLDVDMLQKRENREEAARVLSMQEAPIVVGTWLSIPYTANVRFGLVGVIDADTILNVDDFRAEERAYRLLTQLSKRVAVGGEMVVQCADIQRPIVADIVQNDYLSLIDRELTVRQKFLYPPFVRCSRVIVRSKFEDCAFDFANELADKIRQETSLNVSSPTSPSVDKVRGLYIFYIAIKFTKSGTGEGLKRKIAKIIEHQNDKRVVVSIDVDYQ